MFYLSNRFEELSGISGGLILIILLLIITAIVFAIKFALDVALKNKFSDSDSNFIEQQPRERENKYVYAIKNEPLKKRIQNRPVKKSQYTIIPEDKLFILENPSAKDRYR